MLKNTRKQITDMWRCIRYFASFAWKEYPVYYWYLVLGVLVESLGPFVTIIGTKYLINEISYPDKRDMNRIIFWVAFICIGTLLYRSLQKFASERQYYCADIFERKIGLQLSTRTMKMKFCYTENPEILDRVKRAERAFDEADVQTIMGGIVGIVSGLFVLAGVFYLVVRCSVWLLVPIVLSFVVSTTMTMKRTKLAEEYYKVYSEQVREQDYYMQNLTESKFAKDIRIYKAAGMILDNQAVMGEKIYTVARKSFLEMWNYSRWDSIVSQGANGAIYIILGINTLLKKVTIGDFSSLIQSTIRFKQSMEDVSRGIFRLRYATSILTHYIDFMESIDEESLEEQNALPIEDEQKVPCIEFKNVSFKYPDTDVYILKNVNTIIRPGEHLAIVGRNGAGKTTFIKLLCRLYDVTEGEILLNGGNINRYRYRDYVKMLSVVFQDYKLMAFSILENIAMDESENEHVKSRVRELCKLVELDDWIGSLKNREDTKVYKLFDESGVEPSGGQAQKLSIVRALYKDAPMVILDEPTAALDPVAEYEIYQHFDKLVGGKTAVYISHRLSSCRFCDRIIVFQDGQIIEDGSHDALMALANGFYAKMYLTQAKHYNI